MRHDRIGSWAGSGIGSETVQLAAGRDRAALPLRAAIVLVGTAALWGICHPYVGIIGDSTIYLGRALADLDPDGIGRDFAFAYDGQSRFSLFPVIAKALVGALGPANTGVLIAALADACFLAAVTALARALAPPRTALAIVLALAVLPVTYGQTGVFHFGETAAIPRPFAEAAVVGMLAALIVGRVRLSAVLLGTALALHPIMALAGVGTALGTLLAASGRRAFILAGAALLGLGALALARLGVPLFDRLLVVIDPDWLGLLVERSPHLFPTLWRATSFCPILVQATTILVAAPFVPRRARTVLLCVAAAVLVLLAAALLGDRMHILLVLQIQLWRATWLLAVVGGAGLVACAPGLWDEGPRGRIVLTLLALAWFDQPSLAFTAALCAAALILASGHLTFGFTPRHAMGVAAVAAVLLLIWSGGPIMGYVAFLRTVPPAMPLQMIDPLRNNLHTAPVCLAIALWLLAPQPWRHRLLPLPVIGGAAMLLATGAGKLWDQRSAYGRYVEAGQVPDALASLTGGRPTDVLWIDGIAEPWFLLRQAQWMSSQQAVGIVFSRPLAIEWRRRADSLLALGLARKAIFEPWNVMADDDRTRVGADTVAAFCRRDDAPGLVIVPLGEGRPALDLPGSVVWPVPAGWVVDSYATPEWRETNGLQAIACRQTIATRLTPGLATAPAR